MATTKKTTKKSTKKPTKLPKRLLTDEQKATLQARIEMAADDWMRENASPEAIKDMVQNRMDEALEKFILEKLRLERPWAGNTHFADPNSATIEKVKIQIEEWANKTVDEHLAKFELKKILQRLDVTLYDDIRDYAKETYQGTVERMIEKAVREHLNGTVVLDTPIMIREDD